MKLYFAPKRPFCLVYPTNLRRTTRIRASGSLRFITTGHFITETKSGLEHELDLGIFRSKTIFETSPALLPDRIASATQALAVGPFEVRKNFLKPDTEFRFGIPKLKLSEKLMLDIKARTAVSPTSGEFGVVAKVGPIETQLNFGLKGLSVETARAGAAEVLLDTPDIGTFLLWAAIYGRPPD